MNTIIGNLLLMLTKKMSLFSFIVLATICGPAQAIVINFDELDPGDYSYEGGNPFLTNEYQAQGVVFSGAAYLEDWPQDIPSVSSPNHVAGPGFSFQFVGDLPTYVSFYLGSTSHMAVFIDVFGPDYTNHLTSSGENHGGWPEDFGRPYVPNELFTFYSPTGISSVEFSGRGDVFIDDLTYTYGDTLAVTEPSAFVLFFIGLLALISSRLKYLVASRKNNQELS